MKILNEEINKDIFGIEKKIEFEINGEIYNYESFFQEKNAYQNKIFDKNNDLILVEECFLDDYVFFVDKNVIDEKLFDELNETNIIKISKESYQNAESFTPVELFCKNHEKETNTDIYKISNNEKAPYVKVENFMFKHNNVFYEIKAENRNEFELSRYNQKTNKSNLISEFSVSNNKNDGFYQDFEIHGKKTKKLKDYTISFKDKNCYISTDKSHFDITITHNNLFKTIYKSDKQNLVGTEIDKTEYDPELFKKDIWTKICDVIGDDINAKSYEDMIKNANVINKEKNIENHEKER